MKSRRFVLGLLTSMVPKSFLGAFALASPYQVSKSGPDNSLDELKQAFAALKASQDVLAERISEDSLKVPIGTVFAHVGKVIPTGFVLADGSLLDINKHPEHLNLANLIQSIFNLPADRAGSSRLPNLAGRVIRGAETPANVGVMSGNDVQTVTIDNLPEHRHKVVGTWHASGSAEDVVAGGGDIHRTNIQSGGGLGTWFDYQGTFTSAEPPGGPGKPLSVLQASCNLNYIIKY